MKEFVACMEIRLESVLSSSLRQRHFIEEHNVGAPDISTHSVGDGTDNIVKLRTICGNLDESNVLR
jgi:hypothetical protein